ncbi:MAG: WD40 repeat domain-containing protein [Parachlamydiales bacterium]|nr:WD40 repeat domain-containing protein [Verrucomicrobiota bacterium]MBX3718687.1 WD40 repeat domain-containing protein [Candidatus Acheromyda pituitae]
MSVKGDNTTNIGAQAHHALALTPYQEAFHNNQLFAIFPSDVMSIILAQLKLPQIASFSLVNKLCHVISFTLDNLWYRLFANTFSAPTPPRCSLTDYQHHHILNTNLKNGVFIEQNLAGHEGKVRTIVNANGKIISGSNDTTIKIWDLETRECTHTLRGHSAAVSCLAFDNGKIVSGSIDGMIHVWDSETGNHVKTLVENPNSISCVAISDGKVISGASDGKIQIFDLETGKCLSTLNHHAASITSLVISNGMILSASNDGTLKISDLETGALVDTIDEYAVALAVDKNKVFSASIDNTIKIFDLETGECLRTLMGHEDDIASLTIVENKLISCSHDNVVKIWDVDSGKCLQTIRGSKGVIHDMTYVDGKIVSGSSENTIKVWDLHPKEILNKIIEVLKSDSSNKAKVLKKFLKLPSFIKNKIYEEFSKILEVKGITRPSDIKAAFCNLNFADIDLRVAAIKSYLQKKGMH